MILFINACVREESRTKKIAMHLLSKMNDTIEEVKLAELSMPTVDEAFLQKRDSLIQAKDFQHSMFLQAQLFAAADTIVIAAPYWDLSFPASLKQYFEQINVVGITFYYNESGFPVGLCHAKKLFYVTTAGGPIHNDEYGFGYIRCLAHNFYGIEDVTQFRAENLDIAGADVAGVMEETMSCIDASCSF